MLKHDKPLRSKRDVLSASTKFVTYIAGFGHITWQPNRFVFYFRPHSISSDSSRKQIFREIFLFYHEIVCCVYSLESPHRGDSDEYTHHTIIVYKILLIEKYFLNLSQLLSDLAPWSSLSSSNYQYLKQISIFPKIFEPLKIDCRYMVWLWMLLSVCSSCWYRRQTAIFCWTSSIDFVQIMYYNYGKE